MLCEWPVANVKLTTDPSVGGREKLFLTKKLRISSPWLVYCSRHGQVSSFKIKSRLTPCVWAGVTDIPHGDIGLVPGIYVIRHDAKFMVDWKPWSWPPYSPHDPKWSFICKNLNIWDLMETCENISKPKLQNLTSQNFWIVILFKIV